MFWCIERHLQHAGKMNIRKANFLLLLAPRSWTAEP